ncbi:MAG TPA: hypothetical protein VGP72_11965 [Planctomycetota bacterium]|jgi:hypothetical protein
MRNVYVFVLVACIVAMGLRCAQAGDEPAKISLKVLYAGAPGSQRQEEFVELLGKYFTEVKTVDVNAFTPDAARESDVVILDNEGHAKTEDPPDLPQDYARPTITTGVIGSYLGARRNLKTGYL